MQNEREGDVRDPVDMFGGSGNFGGPGGSIFGRNQFDDPFFTSPFGSMFGPSNLVEPNPFVQPAGPVIRELNSDDDDDGGEIEDEEDDGLNSARPANEPFVDHPDDESDDGMKDSDTQTGSNIAGGSQPQAFKVHSCKVTYGGIDGVYYSSSSTRKMGSDGVIVEECKEADKSKGQATHRISRGLRDKGHSVTRKLNPDGKVDTLQTLHNLNEDELGSFEEAWRSNSRGNLPLWAVYDAGTFGNEPGHMSDSLLLPSSGRMGDSRPTHSNNRTRADPSGGRTKKVIRIPIE